MDVDSLPQPTQERIAQVESAQLVVGVLADFDPDSLAMLCDGIRSLPGSPRTVVLHKSAGDQGAMPSISVEDGSLFLLPWGALDSTSAATPMQSLPAAFESVLGTGEKLGAKACCLVSSKMEGVTPRWIAELVRPLLESETDLVAPYYSPSKSQGLLNNSIVYPLFRCLYGKRIHNPLGPDLGVSQRLGKRILGANRSAKIGPSRVHPLVSLVPLAVCENLQICQVYTGARVYPPTNWMNISSVISQVLRPVFLEMERSAACWQRTRGSARVPERGEHIAMAHETPTADWHRMVETFQLGVRDLQEIWGLVLPPATLLELRKLSRLAPEQVHLPDALWARIVYDFALAHRLRTVNPDHLLGSMTPLYLAWVASYAREMETAEGEATVEQRIERLALAYEGAKPYLVSRWRWPDRFNP